MLDNFLSRTLHHVMGPLHALRGTCEVVSDRLQYHKIDAIEREKNCELLERAADTVTTATRMVADVSDLARFGECNPNGGSTEGSHIITKTILIYSLITLLYHAPSCR